MLCKRERLVLELLSNGCSCCEIAKELNISETTVVFHKDNLRIKLEAKNSCHLISQAFYKGYLKP
jgi:two-component system, NarL family, response regulator NreC